LEYPELKVSQVAQSYFLEGEKHWIKCTEKIDGLLRENKAPKLSTDDVDYIKSKALLEKSLSYMEIPKVYEYLADLSAFIDDKAIMYYYQGMAAAMLKKSAKIQEDFYLESLKINKECALSIEQMVLINIQKNQNTEAEKYLNMYISIYPNSGRADYLKGILLLVRRQNDEAIELLKSSIKKDPKFLKGYFDLANYLEGNNKLNECAEILEQGIKYFPTHPSMLHRIGLIYLKLNNPNKALPFILKASELIPNHAQLYFDLARTYQKLNKKHYASYYLKKAIDIDPSMQNKILN
jgi:tetratricopeptide (TPR) repeat protein